MSVHSTESGSTSFINIASHLPAMAKKQPDTLAVAFPLRSRDANGQREYRQWTYADLDAESDRIARGLRTVGVERGVRTVLMVTPSPEFFALVFALFKVGAVMVGVDPGMGVANLKQCLAEAEPHAFIGIRKAHVARRLLGWAKATNRVNVLVGRKLWPFGRTITLDTVRELGSQSDQSVLAQTAPDETAAILFTSGSTGVPKGVVYTHRNFDAQVRALQSHFGIKPGEIDLCTFPLFALYAPAMGMSAIVPDMDFTRPGTVNPANVIEPIQQWKVTNLFGSPALLRQVGADGASRGVKLPTLRRVISAGAPVPARVIEKVTTMLGEGVQVHTPYGATESLPVASISSDVILGETAALTDAGKGVCVGEPVGDTEVRVIRISDEVIETWSDDLLVKPGEIGEICVRGPQVTRAYFNRDESTKLAKIAAPGSDGDEFFHRMGDLGYFDERGRLWFCGRKSQRVRTKDGDLYTVPCEGVFNAHEAIDRTALVGVPGDLITGATGGAMGKRVRELTRADGDGETTTESDMEQNARTGKPQEACGLPMAPEVVPLIVYEPQRDAVSALTDIEADLRQLAQQHEHTRSITIFLRHDKPFPVDIRHNSKINREKLARWAAKQLKGRG